MQNQIHREEQIDDTEHNQRFFTQWNRLVPQKMGNGANPFKYGSERYELHLLLQNPVKL